MSNAYEKEITSNLGNRRNLILLGCRADADIDYRNDKIASLEAQVKTQDAIINDTSAIITRMVYHADDENPHYVLIGRDVYYELEDMYAPPITEKES